MSPVLIFLQYYLYVIFLPFFSIKSVIKKCKSFFRFYFLKKFLRPPGLF
ncbi:unknown [Streptococcus phage M102AD]|nr:hypothetical protein AVU37_gp40 [Streptococcus phage M102AD]ABD48943.1 unknown [Streptococcus phage M102AD]